MISAEDVRENFSLITVLFFVLERVAATYLACALGISFAYVSWRIMTAPIVFFRYLWRGREAFSNLLFGAPKIRRRPSKEAAAAATAGQPDASASEEED